MDTGTLQDDMQGETTHHSRAGESVITTATRDRFDAAAHAVRPLLLTRLRRAGASPEDAEDVAQEALLRAWDRGIDFADDGDLLRWCTVVARRSHIDRVRRQARLLDLGDLASDSACRELEAVELRHVLGTVSTAMASLTAQERASLQELTTEPHGDRASQVRTAVARHRARYRLRLLVGPFGALVAQLVRTVRRAAPVAAAAGAFAAAVLSVTLGSPHHGARQPPTKDAAGTPKPVTATPSAPARLHHPSTPAGAAARHPRVTVAGRWAAVTPNGDGPAATTPIARVEVTPDNWGSLDRDDSEPEDPQPLVCVDNPFLGGQICTPPPPDVPPTGDLSTP
jgi:DNA-directed RNA polymerase specialized sigma24 family protein